MFVCPGRVQTVAVRLIVERERARMAFHSAEYWDVEATFAPAEPKQPPIKAPQDGDAGENQEAAGPDDGRRHPPPPQPEPGGNEDHIQAGEKCAGRGGGETEAVAQDGDARSGKESDQDALQPFPAGKPLRWLPGQPP